MKGKRLIASTLAATAVFATFACTACDTEPATMQGTASVYTMLATEKYMRSAKIEKSESTELSFVGMKNETQSAQITFTAKTDVSSFDLQVSALTSASGEYTIPKENVSVFAERYLEIYNPFYENGSDYFSEAGFYPDALVPLDKYQKRREDSVEKGSNQALWIDVEIPADAAVGDYDGTFKLIVNDQEQEIDVNLTVYDLTMPEEVHNPTAFDIWYERLAYGEKDNVNADTYQTYYEYLWKKRLTATSVPPKYNSSITAWLDYAEEMAVNPKVTSYIVPYRLYVWPDLNKLYPIIEGSVTDDVIQEEKARVEKGLTDVLEAIIQRNLQLRAESDTETIDLFKKAFIYFEDEPTPGQRINCVRIFCELLNNAKKALKEKYASEFAANPDLLRSFNGVHEISTTNFVTDLLFVSEKEDGTPDYDKADGVQFWCPEMYKFNASAFRATVKERQSYGEKFWWYLCISNTPKPSYYVESLPINMRMQQWMQYDYNISGILYWNVAYYGNDIDNYDELKYYTNCSGEGALLYPGVRYGMKEPISSWRMEQIRLGQQDYELFWMLDNYLTEAGAEVTAQEVISKLGKGMYYGTTIKDAVTAWDLENNRIKLLDILAAFGAGKTQDALALVNAIVSK